jgi:hypothetical protein
MKVFFHFLFTIAIFTIVEKANADAVVLGWDPSTSPHVAGYDVYFGTTAGNYPYRVSAGDATSITISNLTAGATYYFVATAYNSSGEQSTYSPPLKVTIPGTTTVDSGTSVVSAPTATGTATPPVSRPGVRPVGQVDQTGLLILDTVFNVVADEHAATAQGQVDLAEAAESPVATERPDEYTAAVADSETSASTETVAASISQKAAVATNLKPAVQIAQPESIVLAITQSADNPSLSLVQFPVTQGHWYEVQATTNLQNWDSIWQSAVAEADGVIQFADQDAKSYTARFYRVVSH